jgi:hypothetical protein
MTLPTYNTAFVDDVSTIPADFLNSYVRTQIPKAIDGTGGGTYTPSATIEIQGTTGLTINGSGSAARLRYGSRSLTRAQSAMLYNATAGTFGLGGINVGAGESAVQTFDRIPNGATLTAVKVYVDRAAAGGMPTTRAAITVRKRSSVTGTQTTIEGPFEDPTAVQVDYEAHHLVTVTLGTPEVIDNTSTVYWVSIAGESGGTTATVAVYAALCVFTLTDQDEAP